MHAAVAHLRRLARSLRKIAIATERPLLSPVELRRLFDAYVNASPDGVAGQPDLFARTFGDAGIPAPPS